VLEGRLRVRDRDQTQRSPAEPRDRLPATFC
jgi:hypothetical protein